MPRIRIRQNNAESCRRYRESKKDDKGFKENEKNRKKIFRQNMSDEQKERNRELGRERMRKLRMKRKENEKLKPQEKKGLATRKMVEAQRIQWRTTKRKYRANLSAQKRRRIREKQRENYREKKCVRELNLPPNNENIPADDTDSHEQESYRTPGSARVAVFRARNNLPTQPAKFVAVVKGLVNGASPRKRKLLSEDGIIMTPTKKKRLAFFEKSIEVVKEMYATIKESRKQKDVRQRRVMASHIARLKKYRLLRSSSKKLGIRWGTLVKWSKMDPSAEFERAQRKDAMSDQETQSVKDFYMKPEVSVTHSSKKAVLKRLNKQRQTMRRSLRATYDIYQKDNPGSKVSFSKFCKLRPKHVRTQNCNKLDSCLCEKCINFEMKLKSVSSKVQLGDKYEAARKTMCGYPAGALPNKKCARRQCKKCGLKLIKEDLKTMTDSEETTTWYEWKSEKVTNTKTHEVKSKKILVHHSGPERILVEKFMIELQAIAYHLYTATWQHKQYAIMRENLKEGQILSVLDFAENYSTDMQDECQSAHWAKKQVTIHPIVNYYQFTDEESQSSGIKTHEQVFISDDLKHDYHFVHTATSAALKELENAGVRIRKVIQFTDGCSGQYKSRIPFMDISCASKDFGGIGFERNFFESGHGKGPADGCSAVIKSSVSRAVKGRTAVITDAADFHTFCEANLKKDTLKFKRTFHFLSTEDIQRHRPDRSSAVTVKGTRKLHSIRPEKPGVLQVRELSCSCEFCADEIGEKCSNPAVVDDWKKELTSKPIPGAEGLTHISPVMTREFDPLISGEQGRITPPFPSTEDNLLLETDVLMDEETVEDALNILTESLGPLNGFEDSWSASESLRPTVGQFVEVRIPCGKTFRNFIGLVEEQSVSLETGTDCVLLRFMEEINKNGVTMHRWPCLDDRSTEPIVNIVKILPEPQLVDNMSTNRVQFYQF